MGVVKGDSKFESQADILNSAVNGLADKMLDFMRKMDVCEFSLTNSKGLFLHFCAMEEINELFEYVSHDDSRDLIDWFKKNHVDYRGLIPMGLAKDASNLNIY